MLIEFLNQPVMVNGKPFVKDVRINVTEKKQARIKASFYDPRAENETMIPIDLVIYEMKFHIEGIGAAINLTGTEMKRNISFNLSLGYNVLKGKWNLSGTFNNREIKQSLNNLISIVAVIRDLL